MRSTQSQSFLLSACVELLIINQWDGTDLCVSFGLDSFGLPVPDDCFGTANPNPTVLPEQNVTFPDGVTLPPGLSPPPLDDWRNELEDLIFSNDSCLQKDLTRCPERICVFDWSFWTTREIDFKKTCKKSSSGAWRCYNYRWAQVWCFKFCSRCVAPVNTGHCVPYNGLCRVGLSLSQG